MSSLFPVLLLAISIISSTFNVYAYKDDDKICVVSTDDDVTGTYQYDSSYRIWENQDGAGFIRKASQTWLFIKIGSIKAKCDPDPSIDPSKPDDISQCNSANTYAENNYWLTTEDGACPFTWSKYVFCPDGEYAIGAGLKLRDNTVPSAPDQSGINGFLLECNGGNQTVKASNDLTTLKTWFTQIGKCSDSNSAFMIGWAINIDPRSGSGVDNVGLFGFRFICNDASDVNLGYGDIGIGGIGTVEYCPANYVVAGFRQKVPDHDSGTGTGVTGDVVGVNAVSFVCRSKTYPSFCVSSYYHFALVVGDPFGFEGYPLYKYTHNDVQSIYLWHDVTLIKWIFSENIGESDQWKWLHTCIDLKACDSVTSGSCPASGSTSDMNPFLNINDNGHDYPHLLIYIILSVGMIIFCVMIGIRTYFKRKKEYKSIQYESAESDQD